MIKLLEADTTREVEEIFYNTNGDNYIVLDRNDRGDALLVDDTDSLYIVAWNCPSGSSESKRKSWGQGHYFDTEERARVVWNNKYKGNESLQLNETNIIDFYDKEELIEFADDIMDELSYDCQLVNLEADRNNLTITLFCNDIEESVTVPFDMRKIRAPRHILKYLPLFVNEFKRRFDSYIDMIEDTEEADLDESFTFVDLSF